MYYYIKLKQLNTTSLLFTLPYSFYSLKVSENKKLNHYFLYFLRTFFFLFFLKNYYQTFII